MLLDEPRLVEAAARCAEHVLASHLVEGRLRRASRDGRVGAPAGVLEDHVDLAEGLLALYAVTGAAAYATAATRLLDVVLDEFPDADGGFYDTAATGTDAPLEAVGRPQDPRSGIGSGRREE